MEFGSNLERSKVATAKEALTRWRKVRKIWLSRNDVNPVDVWDEADLVRSRAKTEGLDLASLVPDEKERESLLQDCEHYDNSF